MAAAIGGDVRRLPVLHERPVNLIDLDAERTADVEGIARVRPQNGTDRSPPGYVESAHRRSRA